MTIVNVGAWVNGQRPASKAALKAALANGDRVLFDSASPIFGPRAGETITPDSIGEDTLSVAGPDPRTNPPLVGHRPGEPPYRKGHGGLMTTAIADPKRPTHRVRRRDHHTNPLSEQVRYGYDPRGAFVATPIPYEQIAREIAAAWGAR